ncbi:MAG: hypothetical protein JWP63_981 [Candidatus Solibacter sp.]|jgi:hypothetical protein|nr:hypothetical protein [Candidatus Solibacter sp.]
MKLCLALAICSLTLAAQEMQHVTVPTTTSVRPVDVSAHEIVREVAGQQPYSSVLHLKGSVEIKTPVCLEAGANNAQHCSGYVVFRADEADMNEQSGQIEGRGRVTVTREK